MDTLEYVRAYLDDLLVVSKNSFYDHLDKLEVVLERLQKSGLKINAAKITFGVHGCKYLGYALSREEIKPQTKMSEEILAISRPKNVKILRGFLGIVQYYRDIWEKKKQNARPTDRLSRRMWVIKNREESQQEEKRLVLDRCPRKSVSACQRDNSA